VDVVDDRAEGTLSEIRAKGGRVTPARRAVLQAIFETGEHHFTAAEIFSTVEKTVARPDRTTVYRTLDLLTDLGLVEALQLDGEATVYHRSDHHHGHLVCSRCGAIVEVPEKTLVNLARTLERQTGFAIDVHRVAIPGTCERCARG
jgi:Fur family transcriptional regulator, ferric uptake regulator